MVTNNVVTLKSVIGGFHAYSRDGGQESWEIRVTWQNLESAQNLPPTFFGSNLK